MYLFEENKKKNSTNLLRIHEIYLQLIWIILNKFYSFWIDKMENMPPNKRLKEPHESFLPNSTYYGSINDL